MAGRSCWLALQLSQAQSEELQDVDDFPCGTLQTPDEKVGNGSSVAANRDTMACILPAVLFLQWLHGGQSSAVQSLHLQ